MHKKSLEAIALLDGQYGPLGWTRLLCRHADGDKTVYSYGEFGKRQEFTVPNTQEDITTIVSEWMEARGLVLSYLKEPIKVHDADFALYIRQKIYDRLGVFLSSDFSDYKWHALDDNGAVTYFACMPAERIDQQFNSLADGLLYECYCNIQRNDLDQAQELAEIALFAVSDLKTRSKFWVVLGSIFLANSQDKFDNLFRFEYSVAYPRRPYWFFYLHVMLKTIRLIGWPTMPPPVWLGGERRAAARRNEMVLGVDRRRGASKSERIPRPQFLTQTTDYPYPESDDPISDAIKILDSDLSVGNRNALERPSGTPKYSTQRVKEEAI